MADLSKIGTIETMEKAVEMVVLHPVTGEPLDGCVILVSGRDSAEFRRASTRIARERLRSLQGRRGQAAISTEKDLAEMEEQQLSLLAACTLGWRGVEMHGEEVQFSFEAARELYRVLPWLRDQVDQFVGDRANFLPPSGQS